MDEVQLRRLGPSGIVERLRLSETNNFQCLAGRGSSCQIYTNSKYASRRHFSISFNNGQYFITDLKSANGTFVNDDKIQQERVLEFGSIISVGVPSDLHQLADCIVYVFEKVPTSKTDCQASVTVQETNQSRADASPINHVQAELITVNRKRRSNSDSSDSGHGSNQEDFRLSEVSASPSKDKETNNKALNKPDTENVVNEFEESIDDGRISPEINNLITRLEDKDISDNVDSTEPNNEKPTEEAEKSPEEEKDMFSPENDEDEEAYNACTQIDEIKLEPVEFLSQQEWSQREEIIEISDSEDENWLESLSQSQQRRGEENEEEEEVEEDDDVIFLEELPKPANWQPTIQIKKEVDDSVEKPVDETEEDFSEDDRKWVNRLFKSQEEFEEVRLVCSQTEQDSDEAVLNEDVEDQVDASNEKDNQIPGETLKDISEITEKISDDELPSEVEKSEEENLLQSDEPKDQAGSSSPKEQTADKLISSPRSSRSGSRSRSVSLSSISSRELSPTSSPCKTTRESYDSISSEISADEDIFAAIESQEKNHESRVTEKEEEKISSPEVKECYVKLQRIKHEELKDEENEIPKKSPKRPSGSFSPRKDQPEVVTDKDLDEIRKSLSFNGAERKRRLFDEEDGSEDEIFLPKKKPKFFVSDRKDASSASAIPTSVPSTSGTAVNLEKFKKHSGILDARKKRRRSKVLNKPYLSPSSKRIRQEKLKAVAEKEKAVEEEKKEEENRAKISAPLKVKVTSKNRGAFLCEEKSGDEPNKIEPAKKKLKISPVRMDRFSTDSSRAKYPPPEKPSASKPKYPPPDKVDEGKPKYPSPEKADASVANDKSIANKDKSFEDALLGADAALQKRRSEPSTSSKVPKRNQTEKPKSVTEKIPEPVAQPSGKENLPQLPNGSARRPELKSILRVGNNFMRAIRPLAAEKSVRFDDSKKDIRYYEVDEDKSMRSLRTTKLGVVDAGELKYNNVLFQICNWNARWLNECKNVPPEEYPPIHSNQEKPRRLTQKFTSHAMYMRSFLPLLLMDLWVSVSNIWKMEESHQPKYIIACTKYVEAPADDKTESLSYLYCEGILPCDINGQYVKEKDLVTIQLIQASPDSNTQLSQNSAKKLAYVVFGFVEKKETEKLGPTTKIHKALAEKTMSISQENYVCRLKILLKRRRNFEVNMNTTMTLTVVQQITGELRLFRGVCYLPRSPLCGVVLNPNRPDLMLSSPPKKNKIVFKEPLDSIQQDLVSKLAFTCFKTNPSLHLIQGGPGTGKTHVMIALILQLLLGDEGKNSTKPKIIYCSRSNTAVDEVAYKLIQYRKTLDKNERFKLVRFGMPNSIRPEVKKFSTQDLALNHKNKEKAEEEKRNIEAKISSLANDLENRIKFTTFELEDKEKELNQLVRLKELIHQGKHPALSTHASPDAESMIIEKADIICTTVTLSGTTRMVSSFSKVVADKNNQHIICILDDAMQSKEAESILPLMLGVNKLILVGDYHQLRSNVLSKKAHNFLINRSLFERILAQFGKTKDNMLSPIVTLRIQYRMSPNILEYPNKRSYNNQLRNGLIGATPKLKNIKPYMIFVNEEENAVPSGEREIRETKIVEILLKIIGNNLQQPFNVAVIMSSQKQANFMKFRLKHCLPTNVEINTVDKFQGREFNAVIFLNDGSALQPGGLNLALTRAKDLLYVAVLCELTTQVADQLLNLIKNGESRNVVRTLGSQVTHEQILNMVKN